MGAIQKRLQCCNTVIANKIERLYSKRARERVIGLRRGAGEGRRGSERYKDIQASRHAIGRSNRWQIEKDRELL
jgi:hypothetical protein